MIGVLDSGIGGLNILSAIHRIIPDTPLVFFSDTNYFPYGNKSKAVLLERCQQVIESIVADFEITLLVLACNTITTEIISELRSHYSLPIIGIEPGIKPAVLLSKTGKIAVLATPTTISSARYKWLKKQYAKNNIIIDVPAPRLADLIEKQDQNTIQAYIRNIFKDHLSNDSAPQTFDTLVLGCTHYPFIKNDLTDLFGEQVQIIDPSEAVARQTKKMYYEECPAVNQTPEITFITNGCHMKFKKTLKSLPLPFFVEPLNFVRLDI